MLIDIIAGARPNFIKISPIIRAFQNHQESGGALRFRLIHTGQHYDYGMSEQFFKEFILPKPTYNLNIRSMTHGAQTGRMIEGIEKYVYATKWLRIIFRRVTDSERICESCSSNHAKI